MFTLKLAFTHQMIPEETPMTDQAPQHRSPLQQLAHRLTLPALALAALAVITPRPKTKTRA